MTDKSDNIQQQLEAAQARFWSKVNKDGLVPPHCPDLGKCWVWTGAEIGQGRGTFWLDGRQVTAARVAYAWKNGVIAHGLWVLHYCDNPACVRLTHLYLGTVQDNVKDMVARDRQAKGERNSKARCTEDDVIDMRVRYAAGTHTLEELGSEFGITGGAVWRTVVGKNWKHVGGPLATVVNNRDKYHCPQGHVYDEANTYRYRGERICRECRTIYRSKRGNELIAI